MNTRPRCWILLKKLTRLLILVIVSCAKKLKEFDRILMQKFFPLVQTHSAFVMDLKTKWSSSVKLQPKSRIKFRPTLCFLLQTQKICWMQALLKWKVALQIELLLQKVTWPQLLSLQKIQHGKQTSSARPWSNCKINCRNGLRNWKAGINKPLIKLCWKLKKKKKLPCLVLIHFQPKEMRNFWLHLRQPWKVFAVN